MVATRPVTTTADAPGDRQAESGAPGTATGGTPSTGLPTFVALIQSGPRRPAHRGRRRPTAANAKAPSIDRPGHAPVESGTGTADLVTAAAVADLPMPAPVSPHGPPARAGSGEGIPTAALGLHPAWLEAIPASIDELQGSPPPPEPVVTPVLVRPPLGARHRRPWVALPGGHWPWWAWVGYAATIGAVTFVAMYAAALVRVVLPRRQRLWMFRTRRGAVRFLEATTIVALVAAGLVAVAPLGGRQPTLPEVTVTIPALLETPAVVIDVETGVGAVPDTLPAMTALELPQDAFTGAETSEPSASDAPPSEASPSPVGDVAASVTNLPADPAAPVTGAQVFVANTGGRGVAFRNSASWDDRVVPKAAYREGTTLVVVASGLRGDDGAGGTTAWLQVRDARGRLGFVPARFTRNR